MELVDVQPQNAHGGSMRYIIAHKGARTVSDNVFRHMEKEKALGLDETATYETFRQKCENSRDKLIRLLKDKREESKRIAGYAATSKSTTVLNYCGIDSSLIEFISDTTPIKQGKFSPGMHIPIRRYEDFTGNYPDYAVLFAWNHAEEIMTKEQKFKDAGGKWIVFVPSVKVLE